MVWIWKDDINFFGGWSENKLILVDCPEIDYFDALLLKMSIWKLNSFSTVFRRGRYVCTAVVGPLNLVSPFWCSGTELCFEVVILSSRFWLLKLVAGEEGKEGGLRGGLFFAIVWPMDWRGHWCCFDDWLQCPGLLRFWNYRGGNNVPCIWLWQCSKLKVCNNSRLKLIEDSWTL